MIDTVERATQPRDLSAYTAKPDATVSHSGGLPGSPVKRLPVSPNLNQVANRSIASGQSQADYAVRRLAGKSSLNDLPNTALFAKVPSSQVNPTTGMVSVTPTFSIRTVTVASVFATTDYTILADASSGAINVNLPSVPATGEIHNLKKLDSSANAVTLNGNGKLVEGGATIVILYVGTSLEVQYDGAQWRLI